MGEVQRPPVGRHTQRPPVHAPEQHSALRVQVASVARHSPQRPATQTKGGQQLSPSSDGVHAPSRGTHIGAGWQVPPVQTLGAQQSPLVVQVEPVGAQGGVQRPIMQVLGAQHSASERQVAPAVGQGCQTRYEATTSSPTLGRKRVP